MQGHTRAHVSLPSTLLGYVDGKRGLAAFQCGTRCVSLPVQMWMYDGYNLRCKACVFDSKSEFMYYNMHAFYASKTFYSYCVPNEKVFSDGCEPIHAFIISYMPPSRAPYNVLFPILFTLLVFCIGATSSSLFFLFFFF